MRLIFIHGINQQGKSEIELKRDWTKHLEIGLKRSLSDNIDISIPYYGDRLAAFTDQKSQSVEAKPVNAASSEASFIAEALAEQAQAAGIKQNAILAEESLVPEAIVEQGFPMDRRINAIARLLERHSPFHGDLVMRLLRQAYTYLKDPAAEAAVDDIVSPHIEKGPLVIVAHSLGTVIAFKLLRKLASGGKQSEVPLFVTLGSPLPLLAVRSALGPAFSTPKGVKTWLNAVDPDDFIALGQGLEPPNFTGYIDNIKDIQNIPGNPHSIVGYLEDPRVASAVATACGMEEG